MNNALGVTRMITQASIATTRPQRIAAGTRALLALVLAFAGAAHAENVLEEITYSPGPGGQVDVRMKLTEPPVEPKLFTTDSPARIAVDFDNTRNGLTERRITVGLGATNAVSAVEAGGRTRVVVELYRTASYTSRVEGDTLIVSIGTGSAAAALGQLSSNDPTKASLAQRPSVTGIDFRRGKGGEGRVVVNFSGEGASTDLRREGDRLVVDVTNVSLPTEQAERLDVTDFATPVRSVETRARPNGARIEIAVDGVFEQLAYQTGTEYVVEIAPVREESAAEKALKEPEYTGERVTFNFQDIPVRSVLQLIADVSDLNVVVADTVQGNVTLRLVNVPWDQALDIILQAKGLDQRRRGNVIWVAPAAEIAAREQALNDARIALEDRAPLISEYIPINYGKAKDIAELMTSDAIQGQGGGAAGGQGGQGARRGFLSPRGSVTFDERTNTLLVNDTADKIIEIRELIAVLDRPVDQVLIESRIVIASESFSRELGARFGLSGGYEDNNGNIVTTSGTNFGTDEMSNVSMQNRQLLGFGSGLPVSRFGIVPVGPSPGLDGGIAVPNLLDRLNVNLPIASPAGSIALAVLGQDYLLDLELSAAQVEGRGELISSPRVITANQREAVIKQGQEIGFVTFQAGGGGNQASVEFKEAVLELRVTPTITQDRRVFLLLNVKKDAINSLVPNPGGGFVPQLDKREISTGVLVHDGETVVLGGVYEFESRDDLTKVPFLGDIPAIGNLFKTKAGSNNKAELLIFVTPKLLTQGTR